MELDSIERLKKICEDLKDDEPDIDKNFWAVNMHGDELEDDFIVPKGVRIVAFCYPGWKLNICPRFDKFNWREIFLNEEASFNYCTFIANLSRYSSLKNHFCVYEEGSNFRNLILSPDEYFRSGIYKLPVKAAAKDENGVVYVSTPDIFPDVFSVIGSSKRIVLDRASVGQIAKDKNSETWVLSDARRDVKIRLSDLVNSLRIKMGESKRQDFTLLLLSCRTGKRRKEENKLTVDREVQNLIEKFSKAI